jgi:hypothetical protein
MADEAGLDIDVKLHIGLEGAGLGSAGQAVPGFSPASLSPVPDSNIPGNAGNAPAAPAAEPRKPFKDQLAAYQTPCPANAQQKDKQQEVER